MPASPLEHYPALASAAEHWDSSPPANCLAGKTLLITGAGDGIGAVAARSCALFGADIVLLGRTRSKLEQVFDWITKHTETRPVIVPADLEALTEEATSALGAAIDGEYGKLDGLLHNASLLGPKVDLEHYPVAEWQRVFQINVHAPMLLTRGLLPLLRQSNAAAVVFTSSSVGRKGRGFWGAYAASKFALEGTMQILADELDVSPQIRTLSLNPGATRTAMRAAAYPGEDPDSVVPAEAHMDVYLKLFADAARIPHGSALSIGDGSARAWFEKGAPSD
ncbi:MAG: YciK family oxidoreductase [Pseudomonadota bacterium]